MQTEEKLDTAFVEQVEKIQAEEVTVTPRRGRGNPAFYKGMPSLNPTGYNNRNSPDRVLEKPTNRQLREKTLIELVRKLRPYQSKAIQAVIKILDNDEASDQNKLKAAALIVSTYKDLVKDVYDYRYDESEAAEEINKTVTPVFSLKMINTDDDGEKND